MDYNDKFLDDKIGSIDFETYGLDGNGLGSLDVYAGGFAMSSGDENYYYLDSNNENSNDLIIKMFNDIFNIIKNDVIKYNGYKFYCHNLGRFDSITM